MGLILPDIFEPQEFAESTRRLSGEPNALFTIPSECRQELQPGGVREDFPLATASKIDRGYALIARNVEADRSIQPHLIVSIPVAISHGTF